MIEDLKETIAVHSMQSRKGIMIGILVSYSIFKLTDTGENVQKMDASIFDSALSHTCRSDASEKSEEKSVSTFGRFSLWTSFASSPVSASISKTQISSTLRVLFIRQFVEVSDFV